MDGFGFLPEEEEEGGGENRFAAATGATRFWFVFSGRMSLLALFFVLATAGGLGGGSGPFQLETSLILFFCFVLIFWAFGFWLAGWLAGGDGGFGRSGRREKGYISSFFGSFSRLCRVCFFFTS